MAADIYTVYVITIQRCNNFMYDHQNGCHSITWLSNRDWIPPFNFFGCDNHQNVNVAWRLTVQTI